ncbi:MAG: hypothetical protein N2595_00380 [bacterium]|nr:hypothetical protein [bacterium]
MNVTCFIAVSWAVVTLVTTAFAVDASQFNLRLSRYGFTAAAGYPPRGFHRATGWSLGIPVAGLARHDAGNDVLYAGLWYVLFFALPPPAPNITFPIAVLSGKTGSYSTLDYTLHMVGTKPPTVPYPYHAYTIAFTNGIRCEHSFIAQLPDNSQWSLDVPLSEGEEIELALVCSNVFGESAAPTVLMISQIPESLPLAGVVCLALTSFRRGRLL